MFPKAMRALRNLFPCSHTIPPIKPHRAFKPRIPFSSGRHAADTRVKLVVGLLSAEPRYLKHTRAVLEKKFGIIDTESGFLDFNKTTYYNKELGTGIQRIFFSFKELIEIQDSYKLKLYTGKIENQLSPKDKRRVNIDPGYISQSKLVLFTTKDYSHRLHLSSGIFAEITLRFEHNTFVPWPWTYPDYRTKEYIDYFNGVREIYRLQLSSKKK